MTLKNYIAGIGTLFESMLRNFEYLASSGKSVVPERFRSVTRPIRGSIVPKELGSVTETERIPEKSNRYVPLRPQ